MPKIQSVINAILFAGIGALLTIKFNTNKERYALQNEVAAIEREFYLHYLATGQYPKERNFLSQQAGQIIAAYPENFRWDNHSAFLHFTPSPQNVFAPSTIGQPGDVFEHNAKVFKAHAPWSQGFKDHYEASEEEMRQAGVSIK